MRKIAIIGGGVAGLSAGIHAQLKGFETTIYEKHSIAGGQCTSWERNGYHIDGCIHWLTGTKKGTDLYKLWKKLGVLGDTEIIQLDNFGTYDFNGTRITLWKDLNRLQQDLIKISPDDKEKIIELIEDIKVTQLMEIPSKMPMDLLPKIELFHQMKNYMKVKGIVDKNSKVTCEEYSNRFKHPAIQKMLANCMPKGYSFYTFLASMATFSKGDGAIPSGGSREMAIRMEKRYKDLGGKLYKGEEVEEVIIENETAIGIKLNNKTVLKFDYVVAACDAHFTLEKLLKGKYVDKEFNMRYSNPNDYSITSSVYVSLGVDMDMKDYQTSVAFETTPFVVAKSEYNALSAKNYSYDSYYAPKGKTLMISCIPQRDKDYMYWSNLYRDKEKYISEKIE